MLGVGRGGGQKDRMSAKVQSDHKTFDQDFIFLPLLFIQYIYSKGALWTVLKDVLDCPSPSVRSF